ncbi:hypothetical protein [Algoriphagus sp.]|uniref:hypothetical protein n=1 Tax=Algoriphagus sp. TaxID=1872435 RepID=UPI0025EAD781|nr:hypothetical protein [Algoriphagus sp.]
MNSVEEIRGFLKNSLIKHIPPLRINKDKEDVFEVSGTKETMQGKQLVSGFYFASVVPKPKDARLYFFPIYTHPSFFESITPELRKCLKGKSCFHFKRLSQDLQSEIELMIEKGITLYSKEGLI